MHPTPFPFHRRIGFGAWRRAWFWLWLAAWSGPGLFASMAGSLVARLEPDSIAAGETATLQLIFKDCGNVDAPQLPAIPGCRIQYSGVSQQYVVGPEGTFRATIHNYALQPSSAGVIEIPGYSMEVDGQKLASQPLRLTVGKGFDQSEIGFLKVVLEKNEAYLGETLPAEVRFYFKSSPVDIQPVPTLKLDGFVINRQGERRQGNERVGNDIYSVVAWRMALTAVKTGDLALGPAELETIYNIQSRNRRRGAFDDPIFDRVFGGGGERRKLTFTSETNLIRIIAPPREGRPATFNGAVGQFQIEMSATPAKVAVGDPVTVRGKITGRGGFDSLKIPDFPAGAGFQVYAGSNHFEPTDDLGLTGTKTFEQILVPERGELKAIQWPAFSFWNPETRRYESAAIPSMPIDVRGAAVAQAAPAGSIPAGGAAPVVPSNPSSDFRPPTLRDTPHRVLRAPVLDTPWFLGLFALPGAAWAVLTAILRWRARPRDFSRQLREQRSQRVDEAYRKVVQSGSSGNSAEFFSALNDWMQLRLAIALDRPGGAFTGEVIDTLLRPRGLPEATVAQLDRLFTAADQARYSVNTSASRLEALQADAEAVEAVLKSWKGTP